VGKKAKTKKKRRNVYLPKLTFRQRDFISGKGEESKTMTSNRKTKDEKRKVGNTRGSRQTIEREGSFFDQ